MNKAEFQILYDGPALQTNEMDVRDLAPALIAVGDLLQETNQIVYGDATKVQVNVKGSFKTGCFKVDFSLVQSIQDQLTTYFTSAEGITVVAIFALLGLNATNGFGLFPFIQWLKNRDITKITKSGKKGMLIVEVDNEQKEVEEKVITAYQNINVRKALEIIVTNPLVKDGIDTFSIEYKKTTTTVIKKEKEYYKLTGITEQLVEDQTIKTTLQAVMVSFAEGNKWKFSDGNNTFFANVKDEQFIKNVQEAKISFSKADALEVMLKKKAWMTENGLKTDYEIINVIKHFSASKQIQLPFVGSADNGEKNE
ncbi:MAG: hypothetical protein O3B87_02655 [bacterium]|nr:hypothetical protein [bacterium]